MYKHNLITSIDNLQSTSLIRKKILSQKEKLLNYYEQAGPDYKTWSKKYNMHFGYCSNLIDVFNREKMLENLNNQVLNRLEEQHLRNDAVLVDLGCGLGASLRFVAKKYDSFNLKGYTIVPWQVKKANEINQTQKDFNSIQVMEGDYTDTNLVSGSVDAVFAIESACYAKGNTKSDLLKEIYRILKPGGKFVIADGFIKHNEPLPRWLNKFYRQLCQSWALNQLGVIGEVKQCLSTLGFSQIQMENVSWQIAPSVAHVPITVIQFLFSQWLFGTRKMTKERWDNLKSPVLTMMLGLAQKHFGYYFISGIK